MTLPLTNPGKSARQTVLLQEQTEELVTTEKKVPVLLKGMVDKDLEPTATMQDVATTLLARDYKGLNNFGTNGVIEWKQ